MNEIDSLHLISEVGRVLKSKGRAIITFFVKDEDYDEILIASGPNPPRHNTPRHAWIFDKPAYESENWFTTKSAIHPEDAVAIDLIALDKICRRGGLGVLGKYCGNWKQVPGLYFQDILIFEKINN